MSDELQEFLQSPGIADLLNAYDFTQLYERLGKISYYGDIISEFTQLMYTLNVDPLTYMNAIPKLYLYGCKSMDSITIPKNIVKISFSVFFDSDITNINYKGTKDEWRAIKKDTIWNTEMKPYTVNCIDGSIKSS